VARTTQRWFEQLSAVNASVKDVRAVLEAATGRLGEHGQGTILFLDEVHRFNKAQQDALLPGVESGLISLIGATTENPHFEVNSALRSRSTLFRLEPLDEAALRELLERGLTAERVGIADDAAQLLVDRSTGDGRQILTSLGVAAALTRQSEADVIGLPEVEAALGTKAIRYGRDDHYDVISAFIKSIRGSDVDAGLYWLARMLDAGESARFIARRLVILASEDVGMADPQSLLIADAAARAVEFVGLPEAQLNLAQAVIHLATAPKSNSVTTGFFAATEAARGSGTGEVPSHLRDAHYRGAVGLGHGAGYRYPHDAPEGWVEQEYRPPELVDQVYYRPSGHGDEPARWTRWNEDRRSDDEATGVAE
jgi:putative ATPase